MSRPARLALVGAGLLGGALASLRWPSAQRMDVRVGDTVRRADHPLVDGVVTATTDLGSLYAVTGISVTLASRGRVRAAIDVAAVGLLAWTVAQIAKHGVDRERPYQAEGVRRRIREPTGSSFPSGHAAVGTAVAAILAGHAGHGRAAPFSVAAHVAASRVYLGVHYPTDVIGGAGLGLLLAAGYSGRISASLRRLMYRPGHFPDVSGQGGGARKPPIR